MFEALMSLVVDLALAMVPGLAPIRSTQLLRSNRPRTVHMGSDRQRSRGALYLGLIVPVVVASIGRTGPIIAYCALVVVGNLAVFFGLGYRLGDHLTTLPPVKRRARTAGSWEATSVDQYSGEVISLLAGRQVLAGHAQDVDLPVAGSEVVVAHGLYQRQWYGAATDGSYLRSTAVIGWSSALGVATLGATALNSAMNNARSRRVASRNAKEKWRELDSGRIYLSNDGFYLDSAIFRSVLSFPWACVRTCESRGRSGRLEMQIGMEDGSMMSFRIRTEWAQLFVALWAAQRQPGHPILR